MPKGAQTKEKQILQPEDVRILFQSDTVILKGKQVINHYIYAYRFQVLTGLRPSEVMGLKWTDIRDGILHVARSINVHNEVTQGKNDNARRNISLNLFTNAVLEQQKLLLREEGIQSEYVFPNEYGGPSSQSTYYKRWVKYREHSGISSKTSPYELRHTYVKATTNIYNCLILIWTINFEQMILTYDLSGNRPCVFNQLTIMNIV